MDLREKLMAVFAAAALGAGVAGGIESLLGFVRNGFGGTSAFEVIFGIFVGGPAAGLVFGSLGAFVFLAPFLFGAAFFRPARPTFAVAGAAAGLAHTAVGVLIGQLTNSYAQQFPVLAWITLGLGFLMPALAPAIIVAPSAAIGGATGGLLYWRFVRKTVLPWLAFKQGNSA